MVKKGTWVRIHGVLLQPEDRAENLPEDTKKKPLEFWVKGILQEDAEVGAECQIKTLTGRLEEGTLIEENPMYELNYGSFIPELLKVGETARKIIGENHEG